MWEIMLTITSRIANLGYTTSKLPIYHEDRNLTDIELAKILLDMFTKEQLSEQQLLRNVGFLAGLLNVEVKKDMNK